MPFNGSGVFNRLYSWVTDNNNGLDIRADRMDDDSDDIADGLSDCLTKDGQQTPTANLKMGGFRFTNLGAGVATTDSATLGQVQTGNIVYAVATGTANAITLAMTPTVTSIADGQIFRFRAIAANTGATTLQVDANTAYGVVTPTGIACAGGEIVTGGMYECIYSANATKFTLLNPSNGHKWVAAGGTAQAITATYTPANTALYDGLELGLRFSAANTATAPTFAPDGLTAYTITKLGGIALVPGDIAGNLHEGLLRFNLANTRWELLNPAIPQGASPWVIAGGTSDAITATYAPAIPTLYDGLLCGFRASAANTTTTPTFAPNGLTAEVITKTGGKALLVGDIPGALAEMVLRYNLANTRWELLNPTPQVQPIYGAIFGFNPSGIVGTNTTATITVSPGQACDAAFAGMIAKPTVTSWAVSNGNAINGYAGGTTLLNNSTIHFFACNGSSGTGIFASTSLSPTFPVGYSNYARRIFSLNTTGAGALIPVTVVEVNGGGTVNWLVTQTLDISTTTLGTTQTAYTLNVPAGIKMGWLYRLCQGNNNTSSILITSGDETNVAPSTAGAPFTTAPGGDTAYIASNTVSAAIAPRDGLVTTNTSGQIFLRATIASTDAYAVTRGWVDFRRS